ncbi:MAG TPA: hypothetical protein VGF07_09340, partial [Stellaceae bacterium]
MSRIFGLFLAALCLLAASRAEAQAPTPVTCTAGMDLPSQAIETGGKGPPQQPDLLVTGECKVSSAKKYFYGNVNIYDGGSLAFEQPAAGSPDIDFWAKSIIVEANGALLAGAKAPYGKPRLIDKVGGFLTIHLYGKNQSVDDTGKPVDPATRPGLGALCKSPPTTGGTGGPVPCGIPPKVWENNGSTVLQGCGNAATTKDSECIPGLRTTTKDYFYQYGPLYGDGKCANGKTFTVKDGKALCGAVPAAGQAGYFGYKVLAVSYGGTLMLRGYKGAVDGLDLNHLATGNSWMRLNGDVATGVGRLNLSGTTTDRWWLAGDGQRRPPSLGGGLAPSDQIVVTTTDYLPGHSELLTIDQVQPGTQGQGDKVSFTPAIKWFHSGERFKIAARLGDAKTRLEAAGMDPKLVANGAETRAAVALLTRSIRIVSEGDGIVQTPTPHVETFKEASDRTLCPDKKTKGCYYFGGHTVYRQGFEKVQIQGVEFVNLGQGGKLGHYPVHFHMARQVPANTFVKDSSVNGSNTRWYVIHSTQGVTLQRDVGWKSIGHGYYLEDGTETDNNFYSNIGIFARAAIDNAQNPRKVPGILAWNGADDQGTSKFGFPYRSDNEHPTVFWISNGWNNFAGNMAAGAGACGAGYWFVPLQNSGSPDVPDDNTGPGSLMKWDNGAGAFGYAGLQRNIDFAGATPLESFTHNSASSAYFGFQTTRDSPVCSGFLPLKADDINNLPVVREIKSFAPEPGADPTADTYYPRDTGARHATVCPVSGGRPDCSPVKVCANGSQDPSKEEQCTVTVLDHFTSSFTWPSGNYSGVWLRPQWYLVDNSVITDPQSAGLTFISGGDFTRSSVIEGDWTLLENSVLIGHTQPQDAAHAFALDIGPFNKLSGEKCDPQTVVDTKTKQLGGVPNYCLNSAEGISLPVTDFFSNQKLFSIYDGPAYEASNAYLDVTTADCPKDGYNGRGGCIYGNELVKGVLKNNPGNEDSPCYVANAAIGWKQPNGFFYPPSFHSENLYFNNVDIRHFVIQPLFQAFAGSTPAEDFGQGGTYIGDPTAIGDTYCFLKGTNQDAMRQYFNGFTGIDRQTELNDDDGTLTGLSNDAQASLQPPNPLKQTISVNEDAFFTAPVETPECASNIGPNNLPKDACSPPQKAQPTVTAKTSPYDYVATVIQHAHDSNNWDSTCSNPTCYGVPLYRQFLAGDANKANPTREWKHWYANKCDVNLNTPQCRWPFIRMAGENIATRETLTVNNGTYYIDTAVPLTMQQSEDYNNGQGNLF